MKNKLTLGIAFLIVGLFNIIGPRTAFQPCGGAMGKGPCGKSTQAVFAISLIILTIAVLYLFSKTARERLFLSIVQTVSGVSVILIIGVLIKGCGDLTMSCNTKTFPSLYVSTGILLLISIVNIIYQIKVSKNEQSQGT